jgi:extracellular elastinolytic metalloproteinase
VRRCQVLLLLALAAAVIVPAALAKPQSRAGFLSGPQAGDPVKIATDYVRDHREDLGLAASDLAGLAVSDHYASRDTGVTHVYLEQRHRGLEVHNALINVNVARDGSVASLGNRFVANATDAAKAAEPGRSAKQGVEDAARQLGLSPKDLRVTKDKGGITRETEFTEAGVSTDPITARLVYLPVGDALRLAWEVEIAELDGSHWWNVRVDASSGELLDRSDYVSHASYRVFPRPTENPEDGSHTLVTDPQAATASPFGWHDTNGAAGPEFTITRGNNVYAYTDVDANNKPDAGGSPDGGVNLTFNSLIDLTQTPSTYRPAAVTNLFYWNNVVHDVLHGYGFDEAAGNFQVSNYGNGGVDGDPVLAEAQDGSATDNADFATPHDGKSPRMQMFEWTYPLGNEVSITAPPAAVGDYPASGAQFGPALEETGITGAISLVNDGTASTSDGCQTFVGFPAGNIALLDRGTCDFVVKAANAQQAGAIAVIVVQNTNGNPFTMGGTAPINIPAVMIAKASGDILKANLTGLTGTLRPIPDEEVPPNRDSDLDSGVIVHEYGHGVSNRLTGGPNKVNCLSNDEQMGEGWSDFLALVFTARASDTATTTRGMGNYLTWESASGVGIRPTPYTTDLAVNPTTYATLPGGTLTIPHGIGYAWTSMLWEVYWNLVAAHGFNADIYGAWQTGGNNLALQLVIDGMKLQPCSPGFVDGRDAILQADRLLTNGANQCAIWRGFAKRGLGTGAGQGSSKSILDGTANTAVPTECAA